MTETDNNKSNYITPSNTVSQPVHVQSPQPATVVTGTVGHTGAVKYSRSSAAMVSETYVVTTKK